MRHLGRAETGGRRLAVSIALVLAFFLTGCDHSSHTKKPAEAPVCANPPPAAAPAATPAAPPAASPAPAAEGRVEAKPFKLYGTLSPEELECYYTVPNVSPLAAARLPVASPVATPALYAPVAMGPGWNVPIARPWKYIVIHHSATDTGSAASFDREHRERGWDGLGYHFVIGNGTGSGDGQVEVGYRWRQQLRGAHAGNLDYNERGIGLCLVGDFEKSYPTARQMDSLNALVRFLQARCGITANNIIGHDDVPGKKTRCPGRNFSVAAFRAALAGELAALPPGPPVLAPRPRPVPLNASRNVPVRRISP
jgi:hypothetical protein